MNWGRGFSAILLSFLSGCFFQPPEDDGEIVFEGVGSHILSQSSWVAPSPFDENGNFGSAVATDGNWMAVAAKGHDSSGPNVGGVYIYYKLNGQWVFTQKITPDDYDSYDYFGSSVAMHEGRLAIGATGWDVTDLHSSGAVYVYELSSGLWILQALIQPNDPQVQLKFGASVDIYGGNLIVGAYDQLDPSLGPNSGSAYFFQGGGQNWTQIAKVQSSVGSLDSADGFGISVAIFGNSAVVGAPYQSLGATPNVGAAYTYGFNGVTWQELQAIQPIALGENSYFGRGVGIEAESMMVGAYGDNNLKGTVRAYEKDFGIWEESQLIFHSGSNHSFEFFGYTIDMSGERALISAHGINGRAGSAYGFRKFEDGSWYQEHSFFPSDGAAEDFFGWSLALSGQTYVVGSHLKDTSEYGVKSGKVYVFD